MVLELMGCICAELERPVRYTQDGVYVRFSVQAQGYDRNGREFRYTLHVQCIP